MSSRRTIRPAAVLAVAAMLLLSGCASGPDIAAPGETTEVTVTVEGMHFVPDVIDVPIGNELTVTFENTGMEMHDLVFANGKRSMHIAPGETQVLEVGVIDADLDGWCSISNHRQLGMELVVQAID